MVMPSEHFFGDPTVPIDMFPDGQVAPISLEGVLLGSPPDEMDFERRGVLVGKSIQLLKKEDQIFLLAEPTHKKEPERIGSRTGAFPSIRRLGLVERTR